MYLRPYNVCTHVPVFTRCTHGRLEKEGEEEFVYVPPSMCILALSRVRVQVCNALTL